MVTKLQLEIDSAVHKILKKRAKQDGVSVENLIIRLVERYIRDVDSSEIAVRKVANMSASDGRPSPDGRYLSFTNWNYGDLAIRDLITGEERDITDGGQSWENRVYWVCGSVWSPDGKQIAYSWLSYSEDGYDDPNELRIVGLDGSEPRVLYRDESEEGTFIDVHDWSQDGKFILAQFGGQFNSNQKWEIALISVADGSVRVLRSLEGDPRPWLRWSKTFLRLSPDGRYVAYSRSVKEHEGTRDIFLLATDGSGEETPLVEHPADDYGAMWAPDGRSILCGLQVIDAQTGDATPIVKFDPADKVGITGSAWSPDGKTIFYARRREESRSIIAHDLETGKERELCQENVWRLSPVSPDGRLLAFRDNKALKVMPVEGGEPRELFRLQNEEYFPVRWGGHVWTPDGRYILFGKGKKPAEIYRIPAEGGEPQKLLEMDGLSDITIHPDGQRIAFTRYQRRHEVWAMDNILTTLAADK